MKKRHLKKWAKIVLIIIGLIIVVMLIKHINDKPTPEIKANTNDLIQRARCYDYDDDCNK